MKKRMQKRFSPATRGASRGMMLLEVLIAILIFSFGLLGTVAFYARSIQISAAAEDRNRAALLADQAATQILTGEIWTPPTLSGGLPVLNGPRYEAWQARVSNAQVAGLPNGSGTIDPPNATNKLWTISIFWTPPSAKPPNQPNQLVTQVPM